MSRTSRSGNVRKRCDCTKWRSCAHAWYLDFQHGGVRYLDNLDKLIGHHAVDFAEAKIEARRAIDAKLSGSVSR